MKKTVWGIFAVCLWTATTSTLGQTEPRPLPLDPITEKESRAAENIALLDPRIEEALGRPYKVIYIQSIAPKLRPDEREPNGRYADLLLLRGDNSLGLRVLVDLIASTVVDFDRVRGTSVPLGTADVVEALELAKASPEVKRLVGARLPNFRVLDRPITPELAASDYVGGMRHVGIEPADPCTQNRCVALLFTSGGSFIARDHHILVDLNTRRVQIFPLQEEAHHD